MYKEVSQNIFLESKYLDSDIESHILKNLETNIKGKCIYNYGYILDIRKILKITDNTINRANSTNIFNVDFEAEVLKPEIGLICKGVVCMIFQEGIIVNVKNKMKVLIPLDLLNKKYSINRDVVVNESEKVIIRVGMDVKVEIVMIKYERKEFNCIGKIII